MTTPTPAQDAQPVAFLLEYTDPHDGTRGRTVWMNHPKDYELMPGDTVTPLYASPPTPAGVVQALEKGRDTLKMFAIGLNTGRIKSPDLEMLLSDGPKRISALDLAVQAVEELSAALAAVSKAMGVEVKGKANG
jgi:hypothetical protein